MKTRKPLLSFSGFFLLCLAVPTFSCGGSSQSNLTGIDVAPLGQTILVGDKQQYKATAHYSNAPDADVTSAADWSSSVTSTATINTGGTNPGLATGKNAGETMITVSLTQGSSSVSASTNLEVDATAKGSSLAAEDSVVVLVSQEATAREDLTVDGRTLGSVFSQMSMDFPAGMHQFASAHGTHTLTVILAPHQTYYLGFDQSGRPTLVDAYEPVPN
ncbi:MAG TPA: hypothetical protein VEI01_12655 [Terriglobales bacterium]|nr:hypothetical protein [Terriglobales bacterium]